MKPILLNKRKYNWKDVLRALGIFFVHFAAFYFYTFLFIYFGTLKDGNSFEFSINTQNWWIIYPLTFGPFISFLTHILYVETGKTNLRAVLWIHDMTLILAIPIALLISI